MIGTFGEGHLHSHLENLVLVGPSILALHMVHLQLGSWKCLVVRQAS